jgi:hypothetical protein
VVTGKSNMGQTGHSSTDDVYEPKVVEALSGEVMLQVEGGYDFTVCLTGATRHLYYPSIKSKSNALWILLNLLSITHQTIHYEYLKISCFETVHSITLKV